MITEARLNSFLGKHISDICPNKFHQDSGNHCAHFVCHALCIYYEYSCKSYKGGMQPGAMIRVHELFARCPKRSEIVESSTSLTGIIFVSNTSNFVTTATTTTLRNVPRKHVGILCNGHVWHYSNLRSNRKVIKQRMTDFLYHYSGTNSLWHGTLPAGARAISFAQC